MYIRHFCVFLGQETYASSVKKLHVFCVVDVDLMMNNEMTVPYKDKNIHPKLPNYTVIRGNVSILKCVAGTKILSLSVFLYKYICLLEEQF